MPTRAGLQTLSMALLALTSPFSPNSAGAGTSPQPLDLDRVPEALPLLPFEPPLPAAARPRSFTPRKRPQPLTPAETAPFGVVWVSPAIFVAPPPSLPPLRSLQEAVLVEDAGVGTTPGRATQGSRDGLDILGLDLGPGLELHGFLKSSGSVVNMVRSPADDVRESRFTLDNVRLSLNGEVGNLRLFVSADGSTDQGHSYFIRDGEAGSLEILDAYAELELIRGLSVRVGQFKPPVLFSGMIEENELLFIDRTVNGLAFQQRSTGVQLHAQTERLQLWLAVQNGADGVADEVALTARGTWRLAGEGLAPRREGAYDTDLGETVYLGAAWYEDQSISDGHAAAVEAYYTMEAFSLSGEVLLPSEGILGGYSFWNATAAAMIVPDLWELALRYEDFKERSQADVWRLGVNRYLRGPNVKLQAAVSRLDHSGANLDALAFDLTLVASF
jgi:hypothetical protein